MSLNSDDLRQGRLTYRSPAEIAELKAPAVSTPQAQTGRWIAGYFGTNGLRIWID